MASFKFNNVFIKDYYTIVGPKENDSRLKNYNMAINDYYFDSKTFEQAEIKMQKVVIDNLLKENNLTENMINFLIGGDLVNQISVSSYAAKEYKIPFIGVYSACATFIEALILASNLIESKNASNIICVTSSHNLTAERQFRYPSEYGSTRPNTATVTATASVGALLTNLQTNLKIETATVGKIVDLGVNDVNHMGAIMAPACADTLYEHLKALKKNFKDYDLILTGDLGCVGLDILKEYYETVYKEKLTNIVDSGCEIYLKSQDMHAGGSGPCCLPLVYFCKYLKSKRYKNVLLLGTGSLHSPVLVNQHQTICAISHAVSIRVMS